MKRVTFRASGVLKNDLLETLVTKRLKRNVKNKATPLNRRKFNYGLNIWPTKIKTLENGCLFTGLDSIILVGLIDGAFTSTIKVPRLKERYIHR